MKPKLKSASALLIALVTSCGMGAQPLSPEEARKHLKDGAVLVDVRTTGEFSSRSLPGAINIPLDSLESGIKAQVADPSRVILLHCRSGRRSGIAETELRAMGYTNAFNIGGFEDAQAIVKSDSTQTMPE